MLNEKFRKLFDDQFKSKLNCSSDKFVFNATNIDIPKEVMLLSGLGQKFCLPLNLNKLPIFDFIADVEVIIENLENDRIRDVIRNTTANSILNVLKRPKRLLNDEKLLMDWYKKSKQFLSDHPEIILTKSNKGNMTVFMFENEYMNKADEMLDDESTYLKIDDPTNRLQRISNELIRRLFVNKIINYYTKCSLYSSNAVSPTLYFLPKYHKSGLPLRPITSDINGPTNKIAKFLSRILTSVEKSKFFIKNSYQFKEFIYNQQCNKDEIMCSFDAVSLFTNAPMDRIVELIENK